MAEAKDVPGVIVDVLAFDSGIIRDRPGDIKAVLKSLFEALDFIRNNRKEAVKIMADSLGVGINDMELGLNSIVQPDIAGNVGIMKSRNYPRSLSDSWGMIFRFLSDRGQIAHIPEYAHVVDPTFVDDLAADMAGTANK